MIARNLQFDLESKMMGISELSGFSFVWLSPVPWANRFFNYAALAV